MRIKFSFRVVKRMAPGAGDLAPRACMFASLGQSLSNTTDPSILRIFKKNYPDWKVGRKIVFKFAEIRVDL